MTNPGDAVPHYDDALIRRIQDLERFVREGFAARSLAASQIGNGGTLQVDGSLNVNGSISLPGQLSSAGGITATSGDVTAPAGNMSTSGNVTAGGNVTAAGTVQGATVNSTGNISAGGQVVSTAAFQSMGSANYHVVSGYQAMWINSDGTIGVSASTLDSKKDLVPLTDLAPLMALRPRLGRYVWDAETEPLKQFLIAEEVVSAGFGPDVAPLGADGNPLSINYSQLVPALIAKVQELDARLAKAGL